MTVTFKEFGGADPLPIQAFSSTAINAAIDVTNEAGAVIFIMPKDDTITQVGFLCSSVTGTAAGIADDAYTISIQSVDASGNPGGILGGVSPASATLPQSGAAGGVTLGTATYHIITLANSIALQGGTPYALVLQHTGATDTDYINLRIGNTAGGFSTQIPYTATADSTPTWTKATTFPYSWMIRSASRTYLWPSKSAATAVSVGTTTEAGFTFSRNSGYGASNTYGVIGIKFLCGSVGMAAGGTWTVNLYTSPTGTPVIAQTTGQMDSDIVASNANNRSFEVYFPEDALTALTPGTTYGIGISHSAAASFSFYTMTLPDANSRDAYPWGGLTYMTRTLASAYPPDNSDGAFAATTTTVVLCELILADFTAAAGGGGAKMNRIP